MTPHKSTVRAVSERSRRVARLQNMAINSCWKFVAISPASGDIGTSGLEATILDLPLPVWSDSICTNLIRLLDLENVGLAVGILFLSHLEAEIMVFPVWRPPFWSFDFRFGSDYHNFLGGLQGI